MLIVAGNQVPVIALFEVAGITGEALLWHSGPMAVKVGMSGASVVITIVAVVAH